ncbi:unnamed protein product, partial [Rotaria sp. Silwood1]
MVILFVRDQKPSWWSRGERG